MNRNRTILRQWLGAVLGAVIIAVAVPATAWAQTQTPVQQGVRAGNNTTTVNGTDVTAGQVVAAGRGTIVTVTTTDLTGESTPKVAKVTVTKKEDFTATTATITGSETVNKNGTTTLTANVTPSFANTVVWTVDDATKAAFVTGETTTAATVTSVVNPETGQATATLKGLEAGTVTVDVKATGDAAATLNETAKTVTVLNVPATLTTAPTATSAAILVSPTNYLVTTGSASGGMMMYAVTTDNTQPDKLAFSSTRPNSDRATGRYYVWYYVKGDDSHIDSEISSTAIQVLVITTQHTSSPNNPTYFTITAEQDSHNFWLVDGGKTMVIGSTSKTIYKVELYVNYMGNYTLSPSPGTWGTRQGVGSSYIGVVTNVNSNSLTISGSDFEKQVSGIDVWYY